MGDIHLNTLVLLGMFDSYQSIYIRDAIELPPASARGKYQCTIGFSQKFGVGARWYPFNQSIQS